MALPAIVNTLRHKAIPPALVSLEDTPLLPLLIGLSQAVGGGVVRSRRLTHGMVLRGTRRLQKLHAAAPRLPSLEQLFPDNISTRLSYTAEEIALIQALLEFFLGWILHLLGQTADAQVVNPFNKFGRIKPSHCLTFSNPSSHRAKCPTPA